VKRLKLPGQISPSPFATHFNYQQIGVLVMFKKKIRIPTANPTLSVNIWFNFNCKTLLEYIRFGFILCIYYSCFLDAECLQVHWEATGTQEIAACDILNNISQSFLSHFEN